MGRNAIHALLWRSRTPAQATLAALVEALHRGGRRCSADVPL